MAFRLAAVGATLLSACSTAPATLEFDRPQRNSENGEIRYDRGAYVIMEKGADSRGAGAASSGPAGGGAGE